MKVTAKLKNLRISPRKVRIVANVIKNMNVDDAIAELSNLIKKSSGIVEKLLKSAIANGENNYGLDRSNLYVYDIQVGEGTTLKRWLPRAYGRASSILKRSSHITITLEERIEGKNRKTKEQLEKERKKNEQEKKKMEKEIMEERSDEKKKESKAPLIDKVLEEKKSGGEKGWAKKIFRRKSA
jgi:large subunit ribosomal protein L22